MTEPSIPSQPPHRWAQFSLKTLLLLMLLAAAFLSGWSVAYRRAQEAEALARGEADAARAAEMQARDMAEQRAYAQMLLAQQQQEMPPEGEAAPATENEPDTANAALPAAEIATVLRLQAEAWNAGQIDRFMEHYWTSDNLSFSAGGKTTRGWQNTLDRYRERYPTIEQMGRLTFDQLEVQRLGNEAALVLGRWHLARDEDELDGNFSLIVRKIDGRWLIIHDHTSRAEKPAERPEGQ